MNPQPLFYTGGALPPGYPYYVLRQADQTASRAMDKGKLVYTVAPRQMGKTSFLKRLAVRLENQGWSCCFVDLATLKNLERPRWFRHLGEMIARARGIDVILSPLENQQDFRAFLLSDVGLGWPFNPIKFALFLDEMEGLLGLDFSDEFLMTLRDLYQQRDSYPGQLLIAFAGSVDPETLVKDPNISPFNVAEEIVLDDFTAEESLTLTSNLTKLRIPVVEAVHSHIYWWTAGQPHLTQRICEVIEGWIETQEIENVSTDAVDRAVHAVLLAPRSRDKNIKHVLDEIANLKSFPAKLWQRLLAGGPVYSTETGFYTLYLTGAVTEAADGLVRIRNRIYERALAEIEVPPDKPPDEFRYDAFISYSHKDKAWVRDTLLPRLEHEGLRVCIDYRDFEPGAPSLTEMERAVLQSRKTLLVLTPDYLASEWAEFENILASTLDPAARRRRVIPLLLKPCELPLRIRALNYVDFTKPHETEPQFERLIAALQRTALAAVSGEPLSFGPEEEKTPQAANAPSAQKSSAHPNEQPIVDSSRGMRSRYVQTVGNISAEVAAAAFDAFGRDLAPDIGIRFIRKRDIPALVEYAVFTVDIDQRSNLSLGESDRGTVRFQTLPGDMVEVSIEVLPTFPRDWRIPFVTDEIVLNFFNSFVDHLRSLAIAPT